MLIKYRPLVTDKLLLHCFKLCFFFITKFHVMRNLILPLFFCITMLVFCCILKKPPELTLIRCIHLLRQFCIVFFNRHQCVCVQVSHHRFYMTDSLCLRFSLSNSNRGRQSNNLLC